MCAKNAIWLVITTDVFRAGHPLVGKERRYPRAIQDYFRFDVLGRVNP